MEGTVDASHQGKPNREQKNTMIETMKRSRWYPQPLRILFSFRLTMTTVIWWSMKMRMVARRAGRMAARGTYQGFWAGKGSTHQLSLPRQVGMAMPLTGGTVSFGVRTPEAASKPLMARRAITTPKSETRFRTLELSALEWRNFLRLTARKKVPRKSRIEEKSTLGSEWQEAFKTPVKNEHFK